MRLITILVIVECISYTFQHSLEVFTLKDNDKFLFNSDLNILSLMKFLYNQQCVQFIGGHGSIESLANVLRHSQNITYFIKSTAWLMNRNIYVEESHSNLLNKKSTKYCENYLIFLENVSSLKLFIKALKRSTTEATLFPFSKLYFLFEDESYKMVRSEITDVSSFLHYGAHFGYVFEYHSATKSLRLQDLLSINYTKTNEDISSNLIHPFLNRDNHQKEFRITFHECYPYVIYTDEDNLRFDGVEYRLMQLVTQNWKVKYYFRDKARTSISPWITMFDDLDNHTADIAMCAIWLTEYENRFDFSTFHNHECTTLLVPKPRKLNEVTAIYTTLSAKVWLLFGILFFVTGLLLWQSARFEIVEKIVYGSVSRTFLEVMNIATSHGIGFFPDQNSIKILLLSWIIMSLLIGICYTTVYTSRLTSPGFTKLINSIEDFVANDMFCGTFDTYVDVEISLNSSAKKAYHDFHRRIRVFKDQNDVETSINTGQYGVLGSIANTKYFNSYEWNDQLYLFPNFRLIKKTCIFNYYSAFALQKFSPYTELFSDYGLKFREYGFSYNWFNIVYRNKRWLNTFFEDYTPPDNEPKQLNIRSISGALLILLICLTISVVVFLCEIYF